MYRSNKRILLWKHYKITEWNFKFNNVNIYNQCNDNMKSSFNLSKYLQNEQLSNTRFMDTRLVMLKSISVENDYSFQDQIKLSWKGVNTIATKTIEKEILQSVRLDQNTFIQFYVWENGEINVQYDYLIEMFY